LLPNSPEQRHIGIALVSFTTLMFASLDALAKYLVQELPVLQVVWLRFATHVLIMAALLWPQHGRLLITVQRPRLHVLRGLMMCAMTAVNFWALQYLQLAETGAMQFSVPILIAVFSALWLGEKLDLRRWIAILAGFAGVLIIIRPGSHAFHPAILLTLLNAILYASFNLLTRHMAKTESAEATQWLAAAVAAVVLTPFGIWQWQTPQHWSTWGWIALTGLLGGLGHYCVTLAHRRASAAVLGPFLYQQIIYMSALGWLVFGNVPDSAVVLGACVVVGSGLYLLWREVVKQPA
jgi:drug/metabolite transporter (DMT)-like permease